MRESVRQELAATLPTARSAARTLDVAKGVLVTLRRRDADDVFADLVEVAEKYALSPFAVATALVAMASGGSDVRADNTAAAHAVKQEWGALLPAVLPVVTSP